MLGGSVVSSGLIAGIIGANASREGKRIADLSRAIDVTALSSSVIMVRDAHEHAGGEAGTVGERSDFVLVKGRPFDTRDCLVSEDAATSETGIDIDQELDGRYLIAEFRRNEIILRTDRIGSLPVYYCSDGSTIYISSDLMFLTLVAPFRFTPDYEAVAELMLGGIQTGGRTIFAEVKRSLGGARLHLHFGPDGAPVVASARPNSLDRLLRREPLEADADYLVENIDRCVRRENYDGNTILLLTAGQDSFAIALAQGAPRASTTFGEYHSTDRVRGHHRSRRLRHEIILTRPPSWTYGEYAHLAVSRHGGLPGLHAAHFLYGLCELPRRFSLAAVGYLGDAIAGGHFGDPGEVFEQKIARYFCPRYDDLANAHTLRDEIEAAKARRQDEAGALSAEVGPVRAFATLDLEWRQASFIGALFDTGDSVVPISTPLFSDRFLAYALNAPADLLVGGSGYRQALARLKARANVREPRWLSAIYSIEQRLRSWKVGRPEVGQVDFGLVARRSEKLDIEQFMCGDRRVDHVVRMLWDERSRREPLGFPTFVWAASIGLAFRLAGDRSILDHRSSATRRRADDANPIA